MPSTRLSTRQSSIRSPALKQSSLSFASKRNNANTKGKTDKSAPSTPVTVPASPVSIEITADSSSTDAEDEGTISSRASITGESQYPSKRRRLTEDSDSQTMPVNSKKGKGVFRSREGAENSFGTVVASGDAVERPALDLKDKKGKWRKHFGEVRQKMGNIESIHTNGQSTVHHILRVFDL
ncbi:hypothetical protein PHLCEN_2v12243 [Hermanssonia centrifuga]|uniref:Uncharacterized protein n=1 Tax=Hermanssonia centrifuga TaxID=98765 RepID=A0A2R6NHR7_9APHY|nr:hypothetical protein PHLCEN_2v12243 [Hermanssonia centrifuga]